MPRTRLYTPAEIREDIQELTDIIAHASVWAGKHLVRAKEAWKEACRHRGFAALANIDAATAGYERAEQWHESMRALDAREELTAYMEEHIP